MRASGGDFDARMAAIADAVPGFAGVYFDGNQRMVVRLTDATRLAKAERAVRAFAEEMGADPALAGTLSGMRAEPAPLATAQSLSSAVRPVIGGVRTDVTNEPDTARECSLGYNVKRVLSSGATDSKRYFTTAAHCTNVFGSASGQLLGQPKLFGTSAIGRIGNEFLDPPTFTINDDPFCPMNQTCRRSDLAVFQYIDSVSSTLNRVAWPNLGSTSFTQTQSIVGIQLPFSGQTVHKIGRTTGRTTGDMGSSCFDTLNTTVNVVILCTWNATMAAKGGDSGAPVVWVASDGTVWSVGFLWGGNDTVIGFTSTAQSLAELGDADPNGATYQIG